MMSPAIIPNAKCRNLPSRVCPSQTNDTANFLEVLSSKNETHIPSSSRKRSAGS